MLPRLQAWRRRRHDPVAIADPFQDLNFGHPLGADRDVVRVKAPVLHPPDFVLLDGARREEKSVFALAQNDIGFCVMPIIKGASAGSDMRTR